jgi:hypothetical protein
MKSIEECQRTITAMEEAKQRKNTKKKVLDDFKIELSQAPKSDQTQTVDDDDDDDIDIGVDVDEAIINAENGIGEDDDEDDNTSNTCQTVEDSNGKSNCDVENHNGSSSSSSSSSLPSLSSLLSTWSPSPQMESLSGHGASLLPVALTGRSSADNLDMGSTKYGAPTKAGAAKMFANSKIIVAKFVSIDVRINQCCMIVYIIDFAVCDRSLSDPTDLFID